MENKNSIGLTELFLILGAVLALCYFAAKPTAIFLYNTLPSIINFYVNYGGQFINSHSTIVNLLEWAVGLKSLSPNIPRDSSITFIYECLIPIGIMLRTPTILMLVIFLVYDTFIPHLNYRIKGMLSFDELRKINMEYYPSIIPASKVNLLQKHPYKGTWKYPLNAIDFVLKHGGLIYKKGTSNQAIVEKKDGDFFYLSPKKKKRILPDYEFLTLNTELMRNIFIQQLGARLTKLDDFPQLEKILACLFLMAGEGGELRKKAFEYCDFISRNYVLPTEDSDGNIIQSGYCPNIPFENEVINIAKGLPQLSKIMGEHAYVTTFFMRLIIRDEYGARSHGKFVNTMFHWLKPHNEALWRVIHSVGMDCPFPEALAPFSHFYHERRIGTSIELPIVEGAVEDLRIHLHTYKWTLESDLAEIENKQKMDLEKLLQEMRKSSENKDKKSSKQNIGIGIGN